MEKLRIRVSRDGGISLRLGERKAAVANALRDWRNVTQNSINSFNKQSQQMESVPQRAHDNDMHDNDEDEGQREHVENHMRVVKTRTRRRSQVVVDETDLAVEEIRDLVVQKTAPTHSHTPPPSERPEQDLLAELNLAVRREEERRKEDQLRRVLRKLHIFKESIKMKRLNMDLADLVCKRSHLLRGMHALRSFTQTCRAVRFHETHLLRRWFKEWAVASASQRHSREFDALSVSFRRSSLLRATFAMLKLWREQSIRLKQLRVRVRSRVQECLVSQCWVGWKRFIGALKRKKKVFARSTLFWARKRLKLGMKTLRLHWSTKKHSRRRIELAARFHDITLQRRVFVGWARATKVVKGSRLMKAQSESCCRFQRLRRGMRALKSAWLDKKEGQVNLYRAVVLWEASVLWRYFTRWRKGMQVVRSERAGRLHFRQIRAKLAFRILRLFATAREEARFDRARLYRNRVLIQRCLLNWAVFCATRAKERERAVEGYCKRRRKRVQAKILLAWHSWARNQVRQQVERLLGSTLFHKKSLERGFHSLLTWASLRKASETNRRRAKAFRARFQKREALTQLGRVVAWCRRQKVLRTQLKLLLLRGFWDRWLHFLVNRERKRRQVALAHAHAEEKTKRQVFKALTELYIEGIRDQRANQIGNRALAQKVLTKWRWEAHCRIMTRFGAQIWRRRHLIQVVKRLQENVVQRRELRAKWLIGFRYFQRRVLPVAFKHLQDNIKTQQERKTQLNEASKLAFHTATRHVLTRLREQVRTKHLLRKGVVYLRQRYFRRALQTLQQHAVLHLQQKHCRSKAEVHYRERSLQTAMTSLRRHSAKAQLLEENLSTALERLDSKRVQLCFMGWSEYVVVARKRHAAVGKFVRKRHRKAQRLAIMALRNQVASRKKEKVAEEHHRLCTLKTFTQGWKQSRRVEHFAHRRMELRREHSWKRWKLFLFRRRSAKERLKGLARTVMRDRLRDGLWVWRQWSVISEYVETATALRLYETKRECLERWASFTIDSKVRRTNKLLASLFWRKQMTHQYWRRFLAGVEFCKLEYAAAAFRMEKLLLRCFVAWQEFTLNCSVERAHEVLACFHWRRHKIQETFTVWKKLWLTTCRGSTVQVLIQA